MDHQVEPKRQPAHAACHTARGRSSRLLEPSATSARAERNARLLEPAIIQSILAGQQPKCMSLLWFQRNPLPTDWVAQRKVVAGFDA